jgi:hypothetical protein
MDEAYKAALLKIREICQAATDHEAAVRKIEQIVSFAFKRTGEEPGPVAAEEPEGMNYLINLGTLQVDGKLTDAGILQGRVWLNDRQVKCLGLDIEIREGTPVVFNLLGVTLEQAEG